MDTEKTYVMIAGLEESEPAHLTPLQQAILPHALEIEAFWWTVWGITFLYIATRYVVVPFFRKIIQ